MIISENFPYTHEFFKVFNEICKIPHGSGNTRAIAEFCLNYAKDCGCEAVQDKIGNVIIKKSGGIGFENAEPIIIQGHLDMVCEKTTDSTHDFTCDPLKLSFDGKYITAENTTLGGDDGIAIAFGLALIKDEELQLPPLEIVFTVDEETGLFGAADLDGSLISGKNLINLDSEEEGTLLCGCAGGVRTAVTEKFNETLSFGTCVTLNFTGLAGGHSGVEIHKRRLNAAKVMASLLNDVVGQIRLISLVSGSKNNAIPCNAVAKFVVCNKDIDVVLEKINSKFGLLEVISGEDTPKLNIDKNMYFGKTLSVKDTKSILGYLNEVPDGVLEEGKTGVMTSL
ncbi:MAG: aminoacyl-histidine dipeptidase, partial [Clostridia bacterium]|nr:aminoacyl-histidine dipeptidase [Clostridia bacterium]